MFEKELSECLLQTLSDFLKERALFLTASVDH